MVQKLEYNGYTNYETWNCALWLDNEPWSQSQMQEKAESLVEAMENPHDADEITGTTSLLADFIKDIVSDMEENITLPTGNMFADMPQAALREIDYYDIAESQIEDALYERQKRNAA